MKVKKFFFGLFSLMLVIPVTFVLVACGGNNDKNNENGNGENPDPPPTKTLDGKYELVGFTFGEYGSGNEITVRHKDNENYADDISDALETLYLGIWNYQVTLFQDWFDRPTYPKYMEINNFSIRSLNNHNVESPFNIFTIIEGGISIQQSFNEPIIALIIEDTLYYPNLHEVQNDTMDYHWVFEKITNL